MDGRFAAEEAMLRTYLASFGSRVDDVRQQMRIAGISRTAAHDLHGDVGQRRNRQLIARDVLLDQAAYGLEILEFSLRWIRMAAAFLR